MNVGEYQSRAYGHQPCWELVADVYHRERFDISVAYVKANRSIREMADAFRLALHQCEHGFKRTENPDDFCIVLLGRNEKIGIHHCGVWYDGKILHAEPTMVFYEDIGTVRARYQLMEFWTHAD